MLFIFQVGSPIIRRPYLRMPSTPQRDSQSRILLKWGLNQVAYIQTCYIYIYIHILYHIQYIYIKINMYISVAEPGKPVDYCTVGWKPGF